MKTGKRKIFFAALFLIALVFGNLSAQERAGSVTRRLGLFIGSNNGGRDRVMLRYAVSDARAVAKVFGDMGGITPSDNIILVEPSIAEINRQLDTVGRELVSARRNSQRTELVFYYSGHSDEEGLLLNREHYSYRNLRERINRVESDMRIVILDSCSSGAITRAKGGTKAPPFLFDTSVSVEGYAFLTSSSADEVSQESDSIESSYFTHSLVAGLRGAADMVGDGRVTLNELYRFAYAETLAKTETSFYGTQHPSYDMQISGSGDVVLTDIKETSASLLIDGELTGRITIRDSSDFLVAELTKVNQRPMELGLEPGLYRITVQRGDNFYRAEMMLRENVRTPLAMGDFSLVAASAAGNRPRGDDLASGGEAAAPSNGTVYSFFVNVASEPFHFPLIGFVNIARGNHIVPQIGFINWNTGNFSSLQMSFVNTVGGDFSGLQTGFLNTVAGDVKGFQSGFVNIANSFYGVQNSFLNIAVKESAGLQFGFVNVSTQKLKGVQFGFVNYADSIESGVPIGFISIVRHGGFRAIEFGFSEFYPTIGLKLGVERFYTSLFVAYNKFHESADEYALEHLFTGLGIGSIINITKSFFFNLELNISAPKGENNNQILSLVPLFGFKLGKYFSITAGPSVSWVHTYDNSPLEKPIFKIEEYSIDEKNNIIVGAKAALRIHF